MKRNFILFFSLFFTVSIMAQVKTSYIVHSSSNVLGLGADNRAVIKKNTNASLKPFRFKALEDGSYIIALDGTKTLYLSLGTSNGWSTYFLSDSTDARAHYVIEESGSYVKFKNKFTNGYLGTDDSTDGASVFSDKNGSDTKHRWRLSDTPEVKINVDTVSFSVCPDASRQLVEGWGVSLCWWANMCGKWSDKKIDEMIDWMVSPTGLNWNIFRYNIGGGDDPNWTNCNQHHMGGGKGLRAEMEGFQDERGGEYHWERDAAQRKIMLKILEKRPDAVFEAFSNSCPWWMTNSGCCSGSKDGGADNLNPDYYKDFANYLVDVCKHYKDEYGIEFKTLEPFNESVTNFWYQSGVQEGCHFDYKSQVNFVKVLYPILKRSGLNTVISVSDETNIGLAVEGLRQFISGSAINFVSQCNTHTYSGDNRSRSQFGSIGRANGKVVWMSETGSGGSGIAGNLSMTQRLFDDVRYIAPSAWVDWQYMEEANDQWCFVRGSFANATYSKVKNYYVRQQVTRFIKQGYTIVESLNEQSLCAVSPNRDSLVVVLLNTDALKVNRINLPLATIDGKISVWRTSETESMKTVSVAKVLGENEIEIPLPEMSITTMIIPIKMMVAKATQIEEGDTYMIIPQTNVKVAAAAVGANIALVPASSSSNEQMWTLEKYTDGVYRLKNGNGKYATASSGYSMALASLSNSSNQLFNIVTVDDIHSRITLRSDSNKRSWDLEGQNLNEGTKIGVYAYGDNASADTRNWFLVRVASDKVSTGIEEVEGNVYESSTEENIYSVSGIKQSDYMSGVNIIRCSNGRIVKVIK